MKLMQERMGMTGITSSRNEVESQVPGKSKVRLSGRISCSTMIQLRKHTEFCEEFDMQHFPQIYFLKIIKTFSFLNLF